MQHATQAGLEQVAASAVHFDQSVDIWSIFKDFISGCVQQPPVLFKRSKLCHIFFDAQRCA